jgi:hypothetical protein
MTSGKFDFENYGIGELLRRTSLVVPANQRPYMWGERQVENLLLDFNQAIQDDEDDYFLGTIVLVRKDKGPPSIVDGQQRIATTSIILARIRDLQLELHRNARAEAIERTYLRDLDIDTEERVPRLQLNVEDHEFFVEHILGSHEERLTQRLSKIPRASNRRLAKASQIIEEFLKDILKGTKPDVQSDYLNRWVSFIKDSASVVIVTAPDEVGAFRMFETLNDRGLKAGAADILKNYFFSKAGSRLNEAQTHWSTITNSIESLSEDEDERLVTFLRHFWVVRNGPTKERELAKAIRTEITGETKTLTFLSSASAAVEPYVALWSSRHPFWAQHRSSTRNSVDTIANHLRVEQIRPLMFAVALRFDPNEAEKAFRLFVSWSVRFLIYGGRGGMLDEQYSRRAQEVGTGRITKASELREVMEKYVPSDGEFASAFATARVSRAHLARYYLRSIDKLTKDDPQPEFLANEDAEQIALDHVLPLMPNDDWDVDESEAEVVQKMLGNLVLLRANQNRSLGNASFSRRKEVYAESGYYVTRMVADYAKWGPREIRERQEHLADLAVQTWPISFSN